MSLNEALLFARFLFNPELDILIKITPRFEMTDYIKITDCQEHNLLGIARSEPRTGVSITVR